MAKNIILLVLTVALMIAVGLVVFLPGHIPLKLIWFVAAFFLTAIGVYRKMKQREKKIEHTKDPGQLAQDDSVRMLDKEV